MMRESTALRAARYIGRETEPREAVSLGPNKVMVIWREASGEGQALVYDDAAWPVQAVSFRLTGARREQVRDALL